MSTVYVVTSGEYSSLAVAGVFSSLEKAQEFYDADHYHYNEPERFTLDQPESYVERGLWAFSVTVEKGGHAWTSNIAASDLPASGKPAHSWIKGHSGICLRVSVAAKSESQAIKVANEMRMQLLANDEWPNFIPDTLP